MQDDLRISKPSDHSCQTPFTTEGDVASDSKDGDMSILGGGVWKGGLFNLPQQGNNQTKTLPKLPDELWMFPSGHGPAHIHKT